MKKTIFTLATLLFISLLTSAQENQTKQERMDRIKAQKVAFFTEKMELSSTTSQKFWPIYNEYFNKKDSIYHLSRELRSNLKEKASTLTNKQKEEAIDLLIKLKSEGSQLEQKYHQKFKRILSIDQVILLYQAEHEFKMRLFKQLKEMKASRE